MKPVDLSRLGSRTDHLSIAPGAVSKLPRILSFARLAGKRSHEGETTTGHEMQGSFLL